MKAELQTEKLLAAFSCGFIVPVSHEASRVAPLPVLRWYFSTGSPGCFGRIVIPAEGRRSGN